MADELLSEFLNESREHLGTIEADLLAIEEGGADLDSELVNKVFRAAHSLKGGSSFFGLSRMKELAHKAETVLDMLRSRKITPNAEVTNLLLAAFDKLREMINHPDQQEAADITDLVVGLTGLASSYLPAEQKASLSQTVSLADPTGGSPVVLPQVDFERIKRDGQCIYRVTYDLIHDLERKGLSILQVFREVAESGEVLDCQLDFEAAGTLDGPIGNELLARMLFATTMGPAVVHEVLLAAPEKITTLFDPAAPSEPAVRAQEPRPAAVSSGQGGAQVTEQTTMCSAVATEVDALPSASIETAPVPALTARSARPVVEEAAAAPAASTPAAADETLRVSVGLLESLMNLAGELVLSRNQLRAAIARKDEQSLTVADQRLNQVTSELQEAIMRTRLQPIGNVFSKFPRVVRDMANGLHKEIQVDIRGKDVALDRSLIEGLSDPLTHMVRNAVDHGIETPQERLRAGKKLPGTIRIDARHEAGQVVVEISDDGRGIDPAAVANAALAKGLITAERLQGMSEKDKLALIFLPGLSTAAKVTDLSGRGVGMDVVKTNLDRLGGTTEIKSELGKGSLFRIKLPLTLAIIPSLIVSVGGERFAIPQINVDELLRIPPEEVAKRIETVGGAEVLLLRDQIIPLVHLDRLLDLATAGAGKSPGAAEDTSASGSGRNNGSAASRAIEVAVVTTGTTQYGLVVSSFHETEEIVVKPLGRHLKGLREYAGATILGDGTVALILDITGVAAKADFASVSAAAHTDDEAEGAERTRLDETQSLLLFQNGADEVCATPLETVLRIERITPDRVEMAGNRRTVQYRGASLPLVTLADAARVGSMDEAKDLAVIVASVHGREVGLLGAMPVDVVESTVVIDPTTHRQPGIAGSAIIREKTTLIADVFELVDAVYPEWKQLKQAAAPAAVKAGKPVILLAEDSDFFRAQVKKYLEQDGFTVLDAPDGQAAWELLQEHAKEVRAVVTDVEMPRLTGLELAQRIRSDGRFARLPMVALSSLAGEDDVAKGRAAGVNDYLVKLDRDQMLASVHALTETT